MKIITALIILVGVVVIWNIATPNTSQIDYVIDGDTFMADGEKIRMAGIDAPEKGKVGAKRATKWLKSFEGREVEMECYGRGYYGRKICDVYYDSTNLNDVMLELNLVSNYQ